MLIAFCKKSKLYDRENVDLVFPADISLDKGDCIGQYSTIDSEKPSKGDLVIVKNNLYRVFSTAIDFDRKILYAIVEETSGGSYMECN